MSQDSQNYIKNILGSKELQNNVVKKIVKAFLNENKSSSQVLDEQISIYQGGPNGYLVKVVSKNKDANVCQHDILLQVSPDGQVELIRK